MADIRTMNKPVVALGSDLMRSLLELPKKAQKHATTFLTKFQANPRSSGINLERIANAADEKLYSARIDQRYRAIIAFRKAATCTFCCTLETTMTLTNGRKQSESASTRIRGPSSCTIWLLKRKSTQRCMRIPKTKLDGERCRKRAPIRFRCVGICSPAHGRPCRHESRNSFSYCNFSCDGQDAADATASSRTSYRSASRHLSGIDR